MASNEAPPKVAQDGGDASATEPELVPVIPDAVQYKYYCAPEGLRRIRPKKKVAIVFGYVGEKYCGLQWNHRPDHPTIEESLLKALYETDMISLTNMSNGKVQQLLNFERASRTDKGVHALRNVVSMNVMLPYDPAYVKRKQEEMRQQAQQAQPEDADKKEKDAEGNDFVFSFEEAKRLLNLALPPDMHVYALVPVVRSFNSYLCCEGRRYEYYLPTFALMSKEAYQQTFFPPSLAPAQPSLQDVGFLPGGLAMVTRNKNSTAAPPQPQPQAQAANEGGKRKKEENTSTKKSHFPRSKRRKMEDAAAAAAKLEQEQKREEKEEGQAETETEEGEGEKEAEVEVAPQAAPEEEKEGEADKNSEDNTDNRKKEDQGENFARGFRDSLFESMLLFRTIPEDAMARIARYRLGDQQLEHIRALFHLYEGTHSFHNFTPGGRSGDASCNRFLRNITVSAPFVVRPEDAALQRTVDYWSPSRFFAADSQLMERFAKRAPQPATEEGEEGTAGPVPANAAALTLNTAEEEDALRQEMRDKMKRVYPDGIEVVRIELEGQSFMLNQIRKMIGAVVCMAATGQPASFLPDVLLKKGVRMGIPMAPANGLFLSYLDFTGYNRRLNRIQAEGENGGKKQDLDMATVDPTELEELRRTIVAVVLRNEMVEDMMGKWMRSLRHVVRLAWRLELD